MFCRKCGKAIDYEASFCKECEEKFLQMTDEMEEGSAAKAETRLQAEPKKPVEYISKTPFDEFEIIDNQPATKEEKAVAGSRKTGLIKAILAAVLGYVGLISVGAISALITSTVSGVMSIESFLGYLELFLTDEEELFAQMDAVVSEVITIIVISGIIVILFDAPLGIIGLIFGIQSIKCFNKEKREGRIKPVATLILGIAGVVLSALTLLSVISI